MLIALTTCMGSGGGGGGEVGEKGECSKGGCESKLGYSLLLIYIIYSAWGDFVSFR